MSLIRLNDVNVSFDKTQVLREAFFKLEAGDRVGLIGKNGSGKSTILELILGRVAPDTGTVAVELGIRTAYFSQFSELNGESSIAEVLNGLFAHVQEIEAELARIDEEIAADSANLIADYSPVSSSVGEFGAFSLTDSMPFLADALLL